MQSAPCLAPDSPRAILFDLDGTLADTAPELIAITREVLEQVGWAEQRDCRDISLRFMAGMGSRALLAHSSGLPWHDPRLDQWQQLFFELYLRNIGGHTSLFPGVDIMLKRLDDMALPWGIVTDKLTHLTVPLLEHLDLMDRLHCLVCREDVPFRKPHPAPLLHACAQLKLEPASCLYVGDMLKDAKAAYAAGIPMVLTSYGYTEITCFMESFPPNVNIIQHMGQLERYLPGTAVV